ncbi:MAG TPA: serine hydrolase [Thermoanaerobaculia bacterium]
MKRLTRLGLLFTAALAAGCAASAPPGRGALTDEIDRAIGRPKNVTVAVAFADLGSGVVLLREETQRFHAASTMKLPILLAVYDAIDKGDLRADQPIAVRNRFASLMDGSPYSLDPKDDEDPELYAAVGGTRPLGELARRMIVRSSNLAANLLLEKVGTSRVMDLLRLLGADDTQVLRGVEDEKAFRAAMNNTTTAKDLLAMLRALESSARGNRPPGGPSPASAQAMLEILAAQQLNEKIPAGLPPGTRVAHKTGDITGIHHDAAIVYPPGRPPYVLVVLTGGFFDQKAADRTIAAVSRAVWQHVTAQ